jgi:hypothetical protein
MTDASDLVHMVAVLKAGLMLLVRDGLITEERAEERARNLVAALQGEFEFTRLPPFE